MTTMTIWGPTLNGGDDCPAERRSSEADAIAGRTPRYVREQRSTQSSIG